MTRIPAQDPNAQALTRILGCSPDSLPTLPASAWEISQLARDDEASMDQMVRIITKDPPLAARLLKTANSPAFRIRAGGELTDIKRAVVVMGFREVGDLALGLTVISALSGGQSLGARLQLMRLWSHSAAVGLLCEILARDELGWGAGYYCLGLVHDIGKVALSAFRQKDYAKALAALERIDVPSVEVEKRVLSTDHCEAGRLLFRFWNFSPAMLAAVGDHHRPWEAGERQDAAGLTAMADLAARAMGFSDRQAEIQSASAPVVGEALEAFFAERGWSLERFTTPEIKARLVEGLEAFDMSMLG